MEPVGWPGAVARPGGFRSLPFRGAAQALGRAAEVRWQRQPSLRTINPPRRLAASRGQAPFNAAFVKRVSALRPAQRLTIESRRACYK